MTSINDAQTTPDTGQRIPRMRSAKEAAAELKLLDPKTGIRECHIRAMMNAGKVPVVTSGNRRFVNLDVLIEYLNTPGLTDLKPCATGTIRPVAEQARPNRGGVR